MNLQDQPIAPKEQVDQLVEAAARTHGHLCPGQVIGVRMAILGLRLLGYPCPPGFPDIKNLLGIVEIERCLADAITTAAGFRMGRGSLKFRDTGFLAATFMELSSKKAVRILSREGARALAPEYAPEQTDMRTMQTEAYRIMPDHILFTAQRVKIDIPDDELPGVHPPKVVCENCGAVVRSGRVVKREGKDICLVCAGRVYFKPVED